MLYLFYLFENIQAIWIHKSYVFMFKKINSGRKLKCYFPRLCLVGCKYTQYKGWDLLIQEVNIYVVYWERKCTKGAQTRLILIYSKLLIKEATFCVAGILSHLKFPERIKYTLVSTQQQIHKLTSYVYKKVLAIPIILVIFTIIASAKQNVRAVIHLDEIPMQWQKQTKRSIIIVFF